jgi:hypothetical protein
LVWWSKFASIGVGVCVLEPTGICPFNCKIVPEYLFSISDTCSVKTSMETATTNITLVCVLSTSVTSFQNILPISAGAPLNTLSTKLHSDISPGINYFFQTFEDQLNNKNPRKYSIEKRATIFYR